MAFLNPGYEEKVRQVHGISQMQWHEICAFLRGATYCWCKNKGQAPFAANDLIGGTIDDWRGTPLMILYEYYLDGNNDNSEYAFQEAGKAAGRLLFEVLATDRRVYDTWEGFTRQYRWMGNENNVG